MKKLLFFISLFVIVFINTLAQQAQTVYSIIKEDKPHSFYVQQAELWWKEIEKNDKNEDAWYNYYKANRYAEKTFYECETPQCKEMKSWTQESPYLKEAEIIQKLIEQNIPETFTYYLVSQNKGKPNDKLYAEFIQKAHALRPNAFEPYPLLVLSTEFAVDAQKRADYNKEWYKLNDISSGILNFSYNMLMSMKEGGLILTFGDNDTFPLWMLQDVMGIRKDVTVLNVSLLLITEYRNRSFEKLRIPALYKEIDKILPSDYEKLMVDYIVKNKPDGLPLYISTTDWKQFQEYEKNLYLVGVVLEYSKENIDNIALLKNNFENKYALDYIYNQFSFDISQGVVNRVNINYLPGIIKLYEHYKLSGDIENQEKMKKIGLLIGEKAGEYWQNKAISVLK